MNIFGNRNAIYFLTLSVVFTKIADCTYLQGDDLQFQCPSDWLQNGPYCYKYFDNAADRVSSRATCRTYGATLVDVTGSTENQLVGELVANKTDGVGNGLVYWIDDQPWPYSYGGYDTDGVSGLQCTVVAINYTELYRYSMRPRPAGCSELHGFVCKMNACLRGLYLCANGQCINNTICDSVDDCGDNSDERNCSNQCTSVQTGTSGQIQGSSKDCIWTIEGPPGTRIILTFSSISIPDQDGYVEIWIGGRTLSTSYPIKRFTGSLGNDRNISSSNNFMIVLYSSFSNSKNSFAATWTSEMFASGNVTYLEATYNEGIVDYSSDITAPYDSSKIWIIDLGEDLERVFTVTVLNVSLDSSDTLVFYDGDVSSQKTLFSFYGSGDQRVVFAVVSVSDKMKVVLKKSSSSLMNSVKFTYVAGCRSVISASRGFIQSPGYPYMNYINNVNCSWMISTPNNERLTLKFEDLALNNRYSISQDRLTVFVENNSSWSIFSSISVSDFFVSSDGQILVYFNSSALFNGRGFQATFATDCPLFVFSNETNTTTPINTTLGSVISVWCPFGYFLAQEDYQFIPGTYLQIVELICSTYGWRNGDELITRTPNCQRIYCGQPPSVTNAYIANATGVEFGDNVSYSCYPDFTMSGSPSITCNQDSSILVGYVGGTWSKPPSCGDCSCSQIAVRNFSNGNYSYKEMSDASCGAVVIFACYPGYQLNGSATVVCRNASWDPSVPFCQKVVCLVPFTIPNGRLLNSSLYIEYQNSVTVACYSGYRIQNATVANVTCQWNQTLNIPNPQCEDVDECSENPNICGSNSNCTNNAGSYQCKCSPGYKSTTNGSNCVDINECSEGLSHCSDVCSNTNGSYFCSCSPSRVLFTVDGTSGYYLSSSEDGTSWMDSFYINHTCVSISCSLVPPIQNGFIRTTQTIFLYQDSVSFDCNLGYALNGSRTLTCQSDGNWSQPFPSCDVVTCQIPSNSSLSGLISPPEFSSSTPVAFGRNASFSCKRFRPVPMTLYRKCVYDITNNIYRLGLDSSWECPVVDCGPQPIIPGAQLTAPVNKYYIGNVEYIAKNTYYNSTFTVSCPPSYVMNGSTGNPDPSLVICGSDGKWTTGNIQCIGPACSDPGTPPGADQIVPISYESNYQVSFRCQRNGFNPDLPYPMTCIPGYNPAWNSSLPSCIDTEPPKWLNCPNSTTIEKYENAGFRPPNASDNSGLVTQVSITAFRQTRMMSQSYFDSMIALDESYQVTYAAYDSRNNSGVCTVNVTVRDNRPPTIQCSPVYITVADSIIREYAFSASDVVTGNYPSAASSAVTVTFEPSVIVGSSANIGKYYVITATAKNSDDNTASCRFMAIIQPAPCSSYSLYSPANATVSCNATSNTSNTCNVTCIPNHYFYDPALDPVAGRSKIYTCSAGQWTPSAPAADCMEPTFARFIPTYSVKFSIQQNGSDVCYASAVQSWLGNTALQLQNYFQSSVDTTVFVSPLTPVLSTNITKLPQNQISVNVGFDISTWNMSSSTLSYYGTLATSRINGTVAQASGCLLTFIPPASANVQNYVCLPSILRQLTYGDVKYCFPCPRGFYFNSSVGCVACGIGGYQDEPGLKPCKLCPAGTSTSKTGSISINDCKDLCSKVGPGLFNPTTRVVPCSDCPMDQYFANETCVPCPPFTHTNRSGSSSEADCLPECLAGEYSDFGVVPCQKCPKHFYSSANRSTSCSECGSSSTTTDKGSTGCIGESVICNVTNACLNNGTCRAVNHQIKCSCLPGFTGTYCETQINYCDSSPCYYGGTCVSLVNSYYCKCPQGFCYGSFVPYQNDSYAASTNMRRNASGVDDCKWKCVQDSSCYGIDWSAMDSSCWFTVIPNTTIEPRANFTHWTLKRDPFNCTSGRNCEVDMSSCPSASGSCQNGGFCRRIPPLATNPPKCVCKLGYSGDSCETAVNICARENCSNSGSCNALNSVRYQCNCNAGFTGADCSTNINECLSNPCLYGGSCVDGVNSFTCNCPNGFSGAQCENRPNPCAGNPCNVTGVCIEDYTVNSYMCICNPGYEPRPLVNSTAPCTVSFTTYPGVSSSLGNAVNGTITPSACQQFCVNMSSCVAVDFDTRDVGVKCYYYTDPDALTSNRRFYNNSYIYQYVIQRCPTQVDAKLCVKKSFCTSSPCNNGGSCTWSPSGAKCICQSGFSGTWCNKNIDECAGSPCLNGGTCLDQINGYNCSCQPGFNGTACEFAANACGVNPCNSSGTIASQGCVNLITSYRCICKPGYTGINCSMDINECLSLPCLHGGICVDRVNGYQCNCSIGWKGMHCENITNHCSPNPCQNGGTCYTVADDFYCVCPKGTFGRRCEVYYRTCNVTRPCVSDGSVCTESQGSDPSCSCAVDFTGSGCQLDRNYCTGSQPICKNGAQCTSLLDDYECQCVQKYSGRNCDLISDSCSASSGCGTGRCVNSYKGYTCDCGSDMAALNGCPGRPLDSDFDLHFIDQRGFSYAVQSLAFSLGSNQITCSFFLRYDKIGNSGSYFMLFGQDKREVGSPLTLLISMSGRTVIFSTPNATGYLMLSGDVILNDTNWHQVAITWNCVNGWTELWVDSRRNSFSNFSSSIGFTFPSYGLIVLGARLSPSAANEYSLLNIGFGGFLGYISQMRVWSRVLDTYTEIPRLLNRTDVIRSGLVASWGNYEWRGLILRVQPSTAGDRRNTTVAKDLPIIIDCPYDPQIFSNGIRGSVYKLSKEPTAKPNPPRTFTIKSKYKRGQTLAFGKYINTYAVFDDQGNAATCSFSIFIQSPNRCSAPKYSSSSFSFPCSTSLDGSMKTCSNVCPSGQRQSLKYPQNYICGPEGSFNVWNPYRRIMLPSCSRSYSARVRVYIKCTYRNLPNCEDQRANGNVRKNFLNVIKALSTRWSGLCRSDCESVTTVDLTCRSTGTRQRRSPAADMDVLVTIEDVSPMLTSTNPSLFGLSLSPVDVISADIYDNNSINFDYQGNIIPGTVPDPASINVSYVYVCNNTDPIQKDVCVPCDVGSYYDVATNSCLPCPIGQYQDKIQQTSCIPCPGSNTTETDGSRSLSDCVKNCSAGSYYDNSARDCLLCPFSFYQDETGQFYCKSCDPTQESFVNGSTSDDNCTDICSVGTQLVDGECVNCSVGSYRDSSTRYCQQCPSGLTTLGEGGTAVGSCSIPLCPNGQYLNVTNGTCVPCPRGYYKSFTSLFDAANVTCSQCPDNKTTYSSGSTNVTQCILACTFGYEDQNGTCTPCAIGYFKDNDNTTLCFLCPNGTLTNGTGAISADNCTVANCTAGYRLHWNGSSSSCKECNYGEYQDMKWQTQCKQCPNNRTSLSKGLTNTSLCVPLCESGQQYDIGASSCVPCPRGYYRTKGVSPICQLCNITLTTSDVGSLSSDNCTIANCSAGTYITLNNTCEPCAPGSYQDAKWQTSCKSCPSNRLASNSGTNSSNDCYNPCAVSLCGNNRLCTIDSTAGPLFYKCSCSVGYTTQDDGSCTSPSVLPAIYGGVIGGVVGAILLILLAVGLVYACKPAPVPPAPEPPAIVPEAVVENTIHPEKPVLYRSPMYDQSNLQTSYVLRLPSVVSDRGSLVRLNQSNAT